jgi:hypothetical protein
MAAEEEARLHVRVHQRVVLFRAGVDKILIVAGTGVVDEDVEFAEGANGECDALLGGRFDRCVPSEVHRLAARCRDLLAELAQPLFPPRGDDDVRAFLGKRQGCRPANACACSGNERRLPHERDRFRHAVLLLRSM